MFKIVAPLVTLALFQAYAQADTAYPKFTYKVPTYHGDWEPWMATKFINYQVKVTVQPPGQGIQHSYFYHSVKFEDGNAQPSIVLVPGSPTPNYFYVVEITIPRQIIFGTGGQVAVVEGSNTAAVLAQYPNLQPVCNPQIILKINGSLL